jgi:SAM-dependent methyltransferase
MELVPCPITGDREFTPWLEAPDRFDIHAPRWNIVRSNSSGLLMLNPRPDETESVKHYPSESYDPFMHAGNPRSARDRAYLAASAILLRLKASMVMDGLRKPANRIRILDVGCSGGRLLLHLHRNRGIPMENLCGIEPDSGARNAAHRAGLTRIHGGSLDDSPFGFRFDRIIFWHSLEHIHRIGATLESVRRHLEPDGMLVIALPNIDSHEASTYGADWVALDAPRHLYHFTPGSLAALLERHGFSVVEVEPYHPDALYNTWYSEKLRCDLAGRGFGPWSAMRAAATAGASILGGVDPAKSSGFVCRAVKKGQEPPSSGEIQPSDFSISADARR